MTYYLKRGLLFSILLLVLFSQILQAKEQGLNIDPSVAIKELTGQLQSDLIQKLYTGTEQKLMDETQFKELLEPYTNYVNIDTPFTDQGLAFYNKIKEDTKDLNSEKRKAYFKGKFQDNVKGYIKGMIYNKVFDKESQNIISTFGGMLRDAYDEVAKMDKVQGELNIAENSDEYAAILRKYGITGKWVDKVSVLKGKMDLLKNSKTISNIADTYEAFSTIRIAMNSKNPGHKIEALFHLGATFGGRVPILGKFIELYFQVALEYLKACKGIADSLRKFDQYCVGAGTHGWIDSSYADERNVAFAKQFKNDGGTYCRGPAGVYLDIYTATSEIGATANRLYFWVNGKWVYGKESHGGMTSLQHIIQWLRKNSYDKKATDVAFLAKEYNKGKGFDVFVEKITKLVEQVQTEYHRVYETIDTCEDTKVKDFMMNNGQMKTVQSFLGKNRNYEWESIKYFHEDMKEDMIDEFIHRRIIKLQASNLDEVIQALGKLHPSYVRGKVFNEYGGFASNAKVDISNANFILKDSTCHKLTTSVHGSFHCVIDLGNASSVSITLKAKKSDKVSESISSTIEADTYHSGIKISFKPDTKKEEINKNSSPTEDSTIIGPPTDDNVTDNNITLPPPKETNTTDTNTSLPQPLDTDKDGVPDNMDECPDDPEKIKRGHCGCHSPETGDSDGDLTHDCNDLCIDNPNKIELGVCGCDFADEDLNNDGIIDCLQDKKEDIDANVFGGLVISGGPTLLVPGQSAQFIGNDYGGRVYDNVQWISANESVLGISSSGSATAISSGSATIIAKLTDGNTVYTNVSVVECINNSNCSTEQICTNYSCVILAKPDCTNDDECPSGESCSEGICIMKIPDCISDSDCPAGEICSGEMCIISQPECTSNANCISGKICSNEMCITPKTIGCDSDHDCPLDKICSLSNICIPSTNAGYNQNIWENKEADREKEVNDRYAQDTAQEIFDNRYNQDKMTQDKEERIEQITKHNEDKHTDDSKTSKVSKPATPSKNSKPPAYSNETGKDSKLNYYIIATKTQTLTRTAKCTSIIYTVVGPFDTKKVNEHLKDAKKYATLRTYRAGYPIYKSIKVTKSASSKTKPNTPKEVRNCTPCPAGQHIGLDKDKQYCHGETSSSNLSDDAKKSLSKFGSALNKGSY